MTQSHIPSMPKLYSNSRINAVFFLFYTQNIWYDYLRIMSFVLIAIVFLLPFLCFNICQFTRYIYWYLPIPPPRAFTVGIFFSCQLRKNVYEYFPRTGIKRYQSNCPIARCNIACQHFLQQFWEKMAKTYTVTSKNVVRCKTTLFL